MDGFGTRAVTAVIFVSVMLIGILGGLIPYVVLFCVLLFLLLKEYFGLVLSEDQKSYPVRMWFGLIVGIFPYFGLLAERMEWYQASWIFALLLFSMVLFLLFMIELFSNSRQPFQNIAFIFSGFIYITLPLSLLHLITIHHGAYQHRFILGIVLLIWTNDTAAYLVGSRLGKHHLFPRVSPKKTWEGTVGGALFTILAAWGMYGLFPSFPLAGWIILSLIIVFFGSIGDLIESMLKRSIQIKDTGNVLPGHGGLLDRFDSFLYCIPFSVTFILLVESNTLNIF
ncbi:MAG: phosphatidate cytidylyltransferase [Saprospiraceae bacterium]|nr:phosphatidate cytidylyltransferase [Saprospiraceae bacterium]